MSGALSVTRFLFWWMESAVPLNQNSPARCWGGTAVTKFLPSVPLMFHERLRCSISDCARYCTST